MDVVGSLAVASSLVVALIGLPSQIIQNWQMKRVCISRTLVFSVFCGYILWTIHGWNQSDWYLLAGQIPGSAFGAIIIGQIYYYQYRYKRKCAIVVSEEKKEKAENPPRTSS